jgi:hypothetical protein
MGQRTSGVQDIGWLLNRYRHDDMLVRKRRKASTRCAAQQPGTVSAATRIVLPPPLLQRLEPAPGSDLHPTPHIALGCPGRGPVVGAADPFAMRGAGPSAERGGRSRPPGDETASSKR